MQAQVVSHADCLDLRFPPQAPCARRSFATSPQDYRSEAKNTMLRIAEHYDRLAKSAEEQAGSERSPPPNIGKSKLPPPRPST